MADRVVRVNRTVYADVEVPVNIGWGTATVHADHTVTRTCKGCGVSATSAIDLASGHVAEARIRHMDDCAVWAELQRRAARNSGR